MGLQQKGPLSKLPTNKEQGQPWEKLARRKLTSYIRDPRFQIPANSRFRGGFSINVLKNWGSLSWFNTSWQFYPRKLGYNVLTNLFSIPGFLFWKSIYLMPKNLFTFAQRKGGITLLWIWLIQSVLQFLKQNTDSFNSLGTQFSLEMSTQNRNISFIKFISKKNKIIDLCVCPLSIIMERINSVNAKIKFIICFPRLCPVVCNLNNNH